MLGGGAGSFDDYWFQHRRVDQTVHDAHNLYLETLAELGPPGLALLALVLVVPLGTAQAGAVVTAGRGCIRRVCRLPDPREHRLGLGDAGHHSHSACSAALRCLRSGGATPRRRRSGPRVRWSGLGVTGALIGFALLGLLGNAAVSASSKSTNAGHYAHAASQARRAMDFAPWSAEPWRRLGEAQLSTGNLSAARKSFHKAITKDRRDWTLWFELAEASSGRARQQALAEASRLNPLSPEISDARQGNG